MEKTDDRERIVILRRQTDYQGHTRISVEFILELLASGMTQTEILEDYPHIREEDLHAVLEYAAHALKNDIYIPLEKVS